MVAKRRYGSKSKYPIKKAKRNYNRIPRPFTKGNNQIDFSNRSAPLKLTQKGVFRYSEFFNLNPGAAGIAASYVFSLNGLYDPNITGVGHQPRGFDQIMTLYDHYVVTATKVELFISQTVNNGACRVFGVVSDSATIIFSNYNELYEHPHCKVVQIGQPVAGDHPVYMTMEIDPVKFLGRRGPLSDPQLKGSAGANPTEEAYLHVYAGPADEAADAQNIHIRVLITYEAILLEPKLPGQS